MATGTMIAATSKLKTGFECKNAKSGIANRLASLTALKSTNWKTTAEIYPTTIPLKIGSSCNNPFV